MAVEVVLEKYEKGVGDLKISCNRVPCRYHKVIQELTLLPLAEDTALFLIADVGAVSLLSESGPSMALSSIFTILPSV